MSLFCSLKLIKDVNSSLTPKDRSNSMIDEASAQIKFVSPKTLTEDLKFVFNPITNRLRTFSETSFESN
jgi:hypothetical protein